MSLDKLRELAMLLWMPNEIDFMEAEIGYDGVLRPEIIGILTGHAPIGQPAVSNDQADRRRLVLDEHELAIG